MAHPFACCLTRATNTYSEYVIHIALPLQQRLRESALILRYTYIACLVSVCLQWQRHATQKYKQNALLGFHYKNGYANGPQWFDTRTLLVLFEILVWKNIRWLCRFSPPSSTRNYCADTVFAQHIPHCRETVKFWMVRRKSNFAQVGIEYRLRMVRHICI